MKGPIEREQLRAMRDRIPHPLDCRGKRHALVDILLVALAAMVAGADSADGMEELGDVHQAWFRRFLWLRHGIPSQDTSLRLFAATDPGALPTVFRAASDPRSGRSKK